MSRTGNAQPQQDGRPVVRRHGNVHQPAAGQPHRVDPRSRFIQNVQRGRPHFDTWTRLDIDRQHAFLPERRRQVVWMRRIEDLPQKEIASRLQIAEATVEKHLVLGIRALAEAFYGHAKRPDDSATEDSADSGQAHGE